MTEASNHSFSDELKPLLMMVAAALTVTLAVRAGNWIGYDEYVHTHLAITGPDFASLGRPLAVLPVWLFRPHWTAHPLVSDSGLLLLRLLNAWLMYRLSLLLLPGRRSFAILLGIVQAAFIPHDIYLLMGWNLTAPLYFLGSILLTALLALFSYQAHGHVPVLLLALGALLITLLQYEGCFPLMAAVPAIVILSRREHSYRFWISNIAWYSVIVVMAIRFLHASMVAEESYASEVLDTLDPMNLLQRSLLQWGLGLFPLLNTGADLSKLTFLLPGFGLGLLISKQIAFSPFEGAPNSLRQSLQVILAGLCLAWLGFAPYLPTVYGTGMLRVHALAQYGEAVVFAGLISLLLQIPRSISAQRTLLTCLLAGLLGLSSSDVALVQGAIQQQQLTFESNSAYRLLISTMPALAPDTLVYLLDTAQESCEKAPIFGYSMLGLHYLYGEQVIVVTREVIGLRVVLSEQGIHRYPATDAARLDWGVEDSRHPWEQVIVVGLKDCLRPSVLNTIPPVLNQSQNTARYQPEALIQPAWLPPRVITLLPPVQEPTYAPGP